MFAALLFFVIALNDDAANVTGPDGVRLTDAAEFHETAESAYALWRTAVNHQDIVRPAMTAGHNPPETVYRWEWECRWRSDVWDQLDNVLRCCTTLDSKRRCLAAMKRLIGDDAYESRRLPFPCPAYKGRP